MPRYEVRERRSKEVEPESGKLMEYVVIDTTTDPGGYDTFGPWPAREEAQKRADRWNGKGQL